MTTPKVGSTPTQFFSVAAINSSDVWAVGESTASNSVTRQSLTEQWNGTKWSVIASPDNGSNSNILQGVTVSGPTSLWSVGTFQVALQGLLSTRTLTLHTTQG